MKGIYYNRHSAGTDRDDWQELASELILPLSNFEKFFPSIKIQGKIKWRCDGGPDNCGECDSCGGAVKVIASKNGNLVAVHTDESLTHQHIGDFHWDWSGHGAKEWWFDDQTMCLVKTSDYRSETGLTADSSRIIAYNRKVEVSSFRGDCADETKTTPRPGKIWAEFINAPADYRANWTGFAIGAIGGDGRYTSSGGWISDSTPIIGDKLDDMIEILLFGEEPENPTICRHNRAVQAHIISDPTRLSLYLCKSCRMRGVRWEEFLTRNQRDMCPYFRRACKSVIGKSDSFPDWFAWSGDNLLSAQRRSIADSDEHEAFEATYVRRKEGFVRRAILLFNLRTREVRMYRYNGYIPPTLADFKEKYSEGRQILGYLGTERKEHVSSEDPDNGFLTEEAVKKVVQEGLDDPLWSDDGSILIRFQNDRAGLEIFAVERGEVNGLQIVPLKQDESEDDEVAVSTPTPFYAENGTRFYLLRVANWQGKLSIRQNSQELKRVDRETGDWYLLGAKDR